MQNPYSKLVLGINGLFVIPFPKFTTSLLLYIGKKVFYIFIYKLKIIQENAFSEANFSTLVIDIDLVGGGGVVDDADGDDDDDDDDDDYRSCSWVLGCCYC